MDGGESGRFMANVALWPRREPWLRSTSEGTTPPAHRRTIVLQHDLDIGVRQLHGTHDRLLVVDDQGRVLVSASRRPFDVPAVEAFCRAQGLELRRTERRGEEPALPPKAPGYRSLTVPRRVAWLIPLPLALTVPLGLLGPLPFALVAMIGFLATVVLLFALT